MERAPKNPNSSASIRLALLAAQRAGVIEDQPLRILGEDELERRIDGSASHDAIAPMANPAMPSILGYEFVREINHGGQATVYEAIQQRTQRRVAVKVIPGGPYISSRNRARFEREAKALAAVDHANVVKILDLGRTTDGSFFLVMDYIKGPCLDGQIADWRADRFEPQRVLVVFSKIARALEAVHRSGIVHRDLKPSNVLIDSQGEPHVVDFGLAKALQEPDGPHTYTLTGQIIGSLAWASPEQAAGGSATLDVRSDVYTLGVMLHEALTGSFPYAVDGTISEILENIQRAIPKRASRMIRRWGGLDARGVDAMLFKALAKAPCDRYATAADLADDLDRLLARRPTSEHLKSKSRFLTRLVYGATLLSFVGAGTAIVLQRTRAEEPVTVFHLPETVNSVGMKLLRIPPGTFLMGSGQKEQGRRFDELPHQARVESPFWIGMTDVTRRQYEAVMGEGTAGADDGLPVVNVSWLDASEFCRRLSAREHRRYRLPTETEWEYACRAGSISPISGTHKLDSMGWFAGNSGNRIHPVAQLSPNCWGLFDMHGNVNQWCSDSYSRLGAGDDPQQAVAQFGLSHVVKGGSFRRPYEACRAAARSELRPEQRHDDVGFRVAMDP